MYREATRSDGAIAMGSWAEYVWINKAGPATWIGIKSADFYRLACSYFKYISLSCQFSPLLETTLNRSDSCLHGKYTGQL